mmetsp:Transcript_44070/g.128306  ORF Transcript_44070/g.128306 Transcript_44070/m.128306 type:complete len:216 (-) Transcript_44070:930-1577(-)
MACVVERSPGGNSGSWERRTAAFVGIHRVVHGAQGRAYQLGHDPRVRRRGSRAVSRPRWYCRFTRHRRRHIGRRPGASAWRCRPVSFVGRWRWPTGWPWRRLGTPGAPSTTWRKGQSHSRTRGSAPNGLGGPRGGGFSDPRRWRRRRRLAGELRREPLADIGARAHGLLRHQGRSGRPMRLVMRGQLLLAGLLLLLQERVPLPLQVLGAGALFLL